MVAAKVLEVAAQCCAYAAAYTAICTRLLLLQCLQHHISTAQSELLPECKVPAMLISCALLRVEVHSTVLEGAFKVAVQSVASGLHSASDR
jgi:hypothetical protein